MSIRKVQITNYKSIRDISIQSPKPFTVFAGPNASGKSNIFEALEFISSMERNGHSEVLRKFDGEISVANRDWLKVTKKLTSDVLKDNPSSGFGESSKDLLGVLLDFGELPVPCTAFYKADEMTILGTPEPKVYFGHSSWLVGIKNTPKYEDLYNEEVVAAIQSANYMQFLNGHSRIFVNNKDVDRNFYKDDYRLSTACGNLEQVLKRILTDEVVREEIIEWLQLLVPGLESVEVSTEPLSGSENLLIYEKGSTKPFTRKLISDGTINVLSILTAVYQSNDPQFLCIEEPENGLNPKVVKELVGFFREQCQEKGHYIWLNTHSQSLVRELEPDELILVDKKKGETKIKQLTGINMHGLRMDEALLSGVLGGGIPW